MSEVADRMVQHLEARFAPSSFDAEQRTIEVVFSTGAAVTRRDFWTGESWIEELEVSERAIDLSRLEAGAPVLNSHRAYGLGDVLGVVERAWVKGGKAMALLRFSEREEVAPILQDVRAGIIRNVSVGYSVAEWKESKRDDGMKVRRATRWQPAEISLVSVPADASAQVRAAEAPPAPIVSGDITTEKEGRMADSPNPAPENPAVVNQPPAAQVPDAEAIRAAERTRIASLREVADVSSAILERGAIAEAERQAVEGGWSAERFRAALLDLAVKNGEKVKAPTLTPVSQFGRSGDDPRAVVDAMATALAVRAMPQMAARQQDQRWREFASMRPSDMLMELAAARGERVSPRDRPQLIERAFHTISDFPMLLENAGNKMLEAGYATAQPSYRRFFARRPFNDFKAHSFLTAGDFPALEVLGEGGEIKAGTMSEKRERITPRTHAKQLRVTRQMLVNDDLGAFTDFGAMIGRRVADYENALAYNLVNTASGDGPTLAEGSAAVFATGGTRNNKASSASTVTAVALGLGFNAMGAQTSLDGLKLNLQPRVLVCSLIQQFVAAQFATQVNNPTSAGNVNVFSGRFEVVTDANIPNNRWYLFADPEAAPVYVYGYVGGQEGPMVRVHQYVPGTDGLAIEVVHDFAVGAIDFRGGYFNSGVAPT